MCFSFRLKRHSKAKHPNRIIKWIDIESGKTLQDSPVSNSGFNRSSLPLTSVYQSSSSTIPVQVTPRTVKSSTILFKSEPASDDIDIDIDMSFEKKSRDNVDFIITDSYSSFSADKDLNVNVGTSICDEFSDLLATVEDNFLGTLSLCCHLCEFTTETATDFSEHLSVDHYPLEGVSKANAQLGFLPSIEILPIDAMALHRCGFCSFESFEARDFSEHVITTHMLAPPTRCIYCPYASLSRAAVTHHCKKNHPDMVVGMRVLDEPYTMLMEESCELNESEHVSDTFEKDGALTLRFNFNSVVRLNDFMEMYEYEFEKILSAAQVSFEL